MVRTALIEFLPAEAAQQGRLPGEDRRGYCQRFARCQLDRSGEFCAHPRVRVAERFSRRASAILDRMEWLAGDVVAATAGAVRAQDAGGSECGQVSGGCLLGHLGAFHIATAPYPVAEDRVEHRVKHPLGQAVFLRKHIEDAEVEIIEALRLE